MCPEIPLDGHGLECCFGPPEAIGYDGDAMRNFDRPLHARHALDGVEVIAFQRAPEHWTGRDRGIEHIRQAHIDAVRGGTIDLQGDIEAMQGFAQQLELVRSLDRRFGIKLDLAAAAATAP